MVIKIIWTPQVVAAKRYKQQQTPYFSPDAGVYCVEVTNFTITLLKTMVIEKLFRVVCHRLRLR
mgnify:FL=1